ncbi:MAG: hypothetical protein R6V01_10265 [Thermoplasmatota archaeon]
MPEERENKKEEISSASNGPKADKGSDAKVHNKGTGKMVPPSEKVEEKTPGIQQKETAPSEEETSAQKNKEKKEKAKPSPDQEEGAAPKQEKKPSKKKESKKEEKKPAEKETASKKEEKKEDKKEKKMENRSSEKKKEDKVPEPEFAPFEPMDPLKEVELLSREEIVYSLIRKHQEMRENYKKELSGLSKKPEGLKDVKEEEKERRDRINEEVARLKAKRKELKDKNKELRNEFFDLFKKEEKLISHKKEVDMYSQFSKDLEWKLETEAITIDTERRLLDELRDTMNKMRSITDGLTPDEIKSRLNEIQEEMGSNLIKIEEYHRELLEKADESQTHHEKFVGAKKQIREKEGRAGWLKRRIELHKEMEVFWSGQKDAAADLDRQEKDRSIETIHQEMMEVFRKRDEEKGKDDTEDRKKKPKSTPSKKLEIPKKKENGKDNKKSREKPHSTEDGKESQDVQEKKRTHPEGNMEEKVEGKVEKADPAPVQSNDNKGPGDSEEEAS